MESCFTFHLRKELTPPVFLTRAACFRRATQHRVVRSRREITMSKNFIHEFVDSAEDGALSFDTDVSGPQKIEFEVDQSGNVWLSANQAGWLHLAKICAELGLGSYEPGYHFHKTKNFDASNPTNKAEVSLGIME